MTKPQSADDPEKTASEQKPTRLENETPAKSKSGGPGKSRVQAWAKIDAGKGTWRPK